MRITTTILIAIIFSACKLPVKRDTIPMAKKLTDSVHEIAYSMLPTIRYSTYTKLDSDTLYKKSIALVNQAIKIDSNYYPAYWNKFDFQLKYKRYDSAFITVKKLNKFHLKGPYHYFAIGVLYERTGDTVTSKKYFNNALLAFNNVLDSMREDKPKNIGYRILELNKATTLIMLNQEQKADLIIRHLYNTETDTSFKSMYKRQFLGKSKKDILSDPDWY